MTADVERLPLPKYPVDGAGDEDSYNTGWNDCLAECRACVAHATAAKDAEIEALRAEVVEARDGWRLANGTADLAMKHRDEAEALAERLAGALQKAEEYINDVTPPWASGGQGVLTAIRAARHPTAAQEGK